MKKWVAGLLIVMLLLAAAGYYWFHQTRIVIDDEVYPRDMKEADFSGVQVEEVEKLAELTRLERLDLRDTGLTVEEYEYLRQALPDCQILWSVPFQEDYCSEETTELTVTSLTMQDLDRLAYLKNLHTVHAEQCRDYENLMALKQARPELDVFYNVSVGGTEYRENTTELTLENADPEEVGAALPYLSELKKVAFTGTAPENERIYEWKCQYPDVTFVWSFDICGVSVTSLDTELILSDIPMESVEEVENALKYFYDLQWVEMCDCGISSEEMDALWKRHPETRFVWSVQVGVCNLRTDITYFMPYQYGYDGYSVLKDRHMAEMKYCVDLRCMDLGHMDISDYSFLNYMPKMQYLILADTKGSDYSALASLKELKYLELFMTTFDQAEVLTGLTNLEDLNLGNSEIDNIEPLKQMTWLKHLWMPVTSKVSATEKRELLAALPDTVINYQGSGSTGNGWREIPNYYAMRDLMNMPYMAGK